MSEQDGADVIEGRCRRAQDVQYHARQDGASEESAELPDLVLRCVNSEAE